MKENKKLTDAVGMIADEYIEEAHAKKKFRFNFSWGLVGKVLAGVFAILLIINIFPIFFRSYGKSDSASHMNYAAESYDGGSNGYYPSASYATESSESVIYDEEAMVSDNKVDIKTNKKLILTSHMTLETQDMNTLLDSLLQKVSKYGGYIQSSTMSTSSSPNRSYDASIRIPAENYSAFLEELKGEGNTTYYSEETKDITDSYTDIQARLTSLKAQEAKVLEFYDRAESLEDLMSVEERLSEIRYEIEYYETQLKNYDLLVSYSTLNLSVRETVTYTPVNRSFFERLWHSFTDGWNDFISGIEDLIIEIVYNIWGIILFVAIGFGIYFIYKKIRNRKKTK